MQHNGLINIATGRSRKETNWRNKEMLWSELVEKFSVTHYTAETHAEYNSSNKTRQTEIKDIGGFVGGYLSSGRRKSGNVANRQLITLDIDFGKPGLWDDFTLVYGNAAALYSTHKHTPDEPRLRLIVPLDRPVFADEYVAIARRIAGVVGIEYFDDTTFEPHRLMYWPSTSKDGEYLFESQDGAWISADDILTSYRDWTDSSEWPVSSRVDKAIRNGMKKQGDPLEKPGIVGAFCRTYSIAEAIEAYLADAYEACDIEGRYTYKEGSTSGGLVVYDDKYAFSHHGTDPVSGKLCNAFDLVRLHKYGLKDEDAREGTPGNKLPSYTAMLDLGRTDSKVKLQLGRERMEEAAQDFAGMGYEDVAAELVEVEDDSWLEQLDRDSKARYLSSIKNVSIILANDPQLKKCFAFDEFMGCAVVLRNLPWRRVTELTRRVTDGDEAQLLKFLEIKYLITSRQSIATAFETHKEDNSFHPVQDYLNGLSWDGEYRLDTLLVDYQGAEDTDYTRAVTRKTLVAAVKRIFEPGTKFDEVLTLVGEQGRFKSTLLAKLGRQWFSDSFSFHMLKNNKEAIEQIQGFWIVEIGEMSGMNKAEAEMIKSFLSRKQDIGRMAFKKNTSSKYRQCVFFGTTNKRDFLKDPTGNRRFWPLEIDKTVPVNDVFGMTDDEVGQIWAEAVHFYRKGEPLHLTDELKIAAGLMQREHSAEHPWTGIIRHYLDTLLPENWFKKNIYERKAYLSDSDPIQETGTIMRERVCVLEIWCEALGRQMKDIDERSEAVIRGVMRGLDDWREEPKVKKFNVYGPLRRGYFRVTNISRGVTIEVETFNEN